MKRHVLLLIPALLLLAAPAFAGDYGACTADAQSCLDKMAAKVAHKGWMGVEGEADEATGYFKITSVVAEGPAAKAGLKAGYLVTAINGHAVDMKDEAKMKEAMAALVPDAKVNFSVKTDYGKDKDVALTLAHIPQDEQAKMVGAHMLTHATVADTSSR